MRVGQEGVKVGEEEGAAGGLVVMSLKQGGVHSQKG